MSTIIWRKSEDGKDSHRYALYGNSFDELYRLQEAVALLEEQLAETEVCFERSFFVDPEHPILFEDTVGGQLLKIEYDWTRKEKLGDRNKKMPMYGFYMDYVHVDIRLPK